MTDGRADLARITLAVLSIVLLIAVCLLIVSPFLPAIIWATTLVIATWPMMLRVQARLSNSRAWAVAVMTVLLLIVFVVPFWLAIGTIVRHSGQIVYWAEFVATTGLPAPPEWLGELPLVGPDVAHVWEDVADDSLRELMQKLRPYAGKMTQWFVEAVGSFGMVLLQFLLTVAVSAVMFAKGERAADTVRRFSIRLAGSRGEQATILAGQAIRGVALGVVATAFVQASIGAMGLVVVGIPYAAVLSAIMFMLCIAQLGPTLVLLPAVIWMYARDDAVWATVLLIFGLVAIAIDNILRPVLIRRGADLPLLLILAGVIGGLVAFGLIGLFLGPTILAVGYKLLMAWIDEPRVEPAT